MSSRKGEEPAGSGPSWGLVLICDCKPWYMYTRYRVDSGTQPRCERTDLVTFRIEVCARAFSCVFVYTKLVLEYTYSRTCTNAGKPYLCMTHTYKNTRTHATHVNTRTAHHKHIIDLRVEVEKHQVTWQQELKFSCKLYANASSGALEPCICKVSIRKVSVSTLVSGSLGTWTI